MKIRVFFFVLFFPLLVTAQTYLNNIEMFRGDKHTFEFSNMPYDLRGDKITFVVKTNFGSQYPKLIYKRNDVAGGDSSQIYISYKKPYSKISITLKPNETEDLVNAKYVFDIERTNATDSTNKKTLFVGYLNFKNVVTTPWDGVDLSDSGRVFAVLGEGIFDNDFAIWDSSAGFWVRVPVDSVIELLNIAAAQIPDSVVWTYELADTAKSIRDDLAGGTSGLDTSAVQGIVESYNYVSKTTVDTISGEKTFSNSKTVFNGDSVGVRGKAKVDGNFVVIGYTNLKRYTENVTTTALKDISGFYGLSITRSGDYNVYQFGDLFGLGNDNSIALFDETGLFNIAVDSTLIGGSINVIGDIYRNGVLINNGSVGNADSLGGLPASAYELQSDIDAWFTGLNPSSNVLRLGKNYADRRFNSGAYSDVWIIDYVVPPYNLSADWLYPIEHRTDYYNDTLQTISSVANLLKLDGTGTPVWRTNNVNISGEETILWVGDLPDSTTTVWANTGLYGSKITLSEENLTASPVRFPMKVKGYSFDIGTNAYYTYPELYSFYSNLATGNLETAYHFYGLGNYPSYFGGNMIIAGQATVDGDTVLTRGDSTIYATQYDLTQVGGDPTAEISDTARALVTEIIGMVADSNFTKDSETTAWDKNSSDDRLLVDTTGSGGNTATRYQLITGLAAKLESSDIQLFIDTLYRSNDTIYLVQEDGSTLFFVDNNTGGDLSAYWDSTEVKTYVTQQTAGDTSNYTVAEMDSILANAKMEWDSTASTGYATQNDLTTGLATKLESSDIQLFVDTLYRSNDTIYFVQKDGSTLFFIDATGSGSMTSAQATQLNMLWAFHSPLDTTATDPNIPDSSDAALSTVIASYVFDIDNQDVGRFYNTTSSEFRLYHPTASWTSWYNNTGSNPIFSRADSMQVRDTSSASNSTAVNVIPYIAGVVDTFTITTVADVSDNTPPTPPSDYLAIGGTSETQYVTTWTDPVAVDLLKLYWYEGSSNDTTTLVLVDSINAGIGTYTRTGRSASTTYWSAVKAVDDSGNVSWFSNIDSATTVAVGGGGAYLPDIIYADTAITSSAGSNILTFTHWASISANDFITLILIKEGSASDTQWGTGADTVSEAGWTFRGSWAAQAQGGAPDIAIGIFTRIATGSETGNFTVRAAEVDEQCGWYLVLDSVDTTDPWNVVGDTTVVLGAANASSITLEAATTDADYCLAFGIAGIKGTGNFNEVDTINVSGTGWALGPLDSVNTNRISNFTSGGIYAVKNILTAGSTGTVTINHGFPEDINNDGSFGFIFAIKGKND